MKTIELNEQQVEFLKLELKWMLEEEVHSKTAKTVMKQIINKLNKE